MCGVVGKVQMETAEPTSDICIPFYSIQSQTIHTLHLIYLTIEHMQ